MATRTIVTAQPDVMCDVCERRLLRGEQPDVFIAAGRRRIVCELCAPRAAHEGWLRESESQSLNLPPARARRGRSLLDRLPVPSWVRHVAQPEQDTPAEPADRVARRAVSGAAPSAQSGRSEAVQPYDAFAEQPIRGAHDEPAAGLHDHQDGAAEVQPPPGTANGGGWESEPGSEPALAPGPASTTTTPSGSATSDEDALYMQDAITVFNASEFPRRVAGVARSLGPPSVSVRCAEHLSSVVSVVVAWELCWYRYQVDLSEPVVEAQLIAQGTELGELEREERTANAAVAESGSLALSAV